jgi:hypothetical protein
VGNSADLVTREHFLDAHERTRFGAGVCAELETVRIQALPAPVNVEIRD